MPTMIDSQSVLSLQIQEDLILVTFACQVTGNAGARIACGEIKLQTKASSGECGQGRRPLVVAESQISVAWKRVSTAGHRNLEWVWRQRCASLNLSQLADWPSPGILLRERSGLWHWCIRTKMMLGRPTEIRTDLQQPISFNPGVIRPGKCLSNSWMIFSAT